MTTTHHRTTTLVSLWNFSLSLSPFYVISVALSKATKIDSINDSNSILSPNESETICVVCFPLLASSWNNANVLRGGKNDFIFLLLLPPDWNERVTMRIWKFVECQSNDYSAFVVVIKWSNVMCECITHAYRLSYVNSIHFKSDSVNCSHTHAHTHTLLNVDARSENENFLSGRSFSFDWIHLGCARERKNTFHWTRGGSSSSSSVLWAFL